MKISNRLVAAAVLGVVAAAAAGCSSSKSTTAATSPTPAVSTSASAPASEAPSVPATPTPAASPVKAGLISCSVTSAQLLTVLKANKTMYDNAGNPTALNKPTCVTGFAAARDANNPDGGERGYVLFGLKPGTHTWVVLNLGTSGYCTGFVPKKLADLLPNCAV